MYNSILYGFRHRSGKKVQYFLGFMAAAGTGVIPDIGNWRATDDGALSGGSDQTSESVG
jgi:hypothetical protein